MAANISYTVNSSGEKVYYPWGVFGKGRIIDSPDKETAVASFERSTLIVFALGFFALIGFDLYQDFVAETFPTEQISIFIPIVLASWGGKLILSRLYLRGTRVTEEKLPTSKNFTFSMIMIAVVAVVLYGLLGLADLSATLQQWPRFLFVPGAIVLACVYAISRNRTKPQI